MKKSIVIHFDVPENDLCYINGTGTKAFFDIFVTPAITHYLMLSAKNANNEGLCSHIENKLQCLSSVVVDDKFTDDRKKYDELVSSIKFQIKQHDGGDEMKSMGESFRDEYIVSMLKQMLKQNGVE